MSKSCPLDRRNWGGDCGERGCGIYNESKCCCGLAALPEVKESMMALIEALGMFSENMQRQVLGHSMAYTEDAFLSLIPKERSL